MSEPIVGTNLTTVVEFNETALALSDLRERYKGLVVDVQTPKGLKEAKTFTFELRTLRTTLEKRRKDLKAPIIERGKQLDDEAKRITAEIVALEEPIDVQIKAEEARIENARLVKLEADRQRVEAIQTKIQAIRDVAASLVGKPSVIIAGQLAKLRETALDESELGEYYVTATDALTAATVRVEQLLAAQQEADAEKKRQAERDAEMEAMRVKMAEQQRLIDEAEEAKRVEQERLAQVERDRVEAEERERQAVAQAQRNEITKLAFVPPIANWTCDEIDAYIAKYRKLDPHDADNTFDFGELQGDACDKFDAAMAQLHEIRREAVRREREEYEAAERRQQEEAAMQAERERLDAQQALLAKEAAAMAKERAAAAKKAEADRLANLGLREAAQAVVDYFPNEPEDQKLAALVADLYTALANDAEQAKPARVKRGAK